MSGILRDIHLASKGGDELQSVPSAQLETNRGIVGDRYYGGAGTFSEKLDGLPDMQVTLIEQEEIDSFNEKTGAGYTGKDFRRNLVTGNIRLNALVGRQFTIGGVRLEGIRLCEPCAHLSGLLGPAIMEHMVHRCGLRARIIAGGGISPSDTISLL